MLASFTHSHDDSSSSNASSMEGMVASFARSCDDSSKAGLKEGIVASFPRSCDDSSKDSTKEGMVASFARYHDDSSKASSMEGMRASFVCSCDDIRKASLIEGMVASFARFRDSSSKASSKEGIVVDITIIDLAPFPCGDSPHKDAWLAMMTMPGDVDGTHKAVWAVMMSMPGHGTKNHYLATRNDDCKTDTWTEREDHICAQGASSCDALSLNMCCGTLVPLGSDTLTAIVMSPHVRLCSRAAAHDHRAAAMASYVEARSRVVKGSDSAIGLYQDTSTPFAAVFTGCNCDGCIGLKAGMIYKMKCYNCVCRFKSTPKCLSIHQDTLSCHESCGSSLCPKCHAGGVLVDEHQQCTTCGKHTCHLCNNSMDYVNCWKCSVAICNVTLNRCIVRCDNCEHHYCEECWLDDVGHHCECGSFRRCV
jgi:hypothetical protein